MPKQESVVSFYVDHGDMLHAGPGMCDRVVGGMGAAGDSGWAQDVLTDRSVRACACVVRELTNAS